MIRIGFMPPLTAEWIGGINYYRNLISALADIFPDKIEPIMIIPERSDTSLLSGFPDVPILKRNLFQRYRPSWFVQKIFERIFKYDLFLGQFLKKNDIQVLSHSFVPVDDFPVPTLSWIPDFQHIHLPEFFSPREIRRRDAAFARAAKYSSVVMLSSYNARNDFQTLFPQYAEKAKVLQFVVDCPKVDSIPPLARLENKYGFQGPYFHLPNQFWIHKNHRLVIDALAILNRSGREVSVLVTGNTNDYRQPAFFGELMARAKAAGVSDSFRVLGLVPYEDLVGLMTHSVAIINPSLFEGWSTTVEEAKTLGKRVLLSDIPVHREQDPQRGIYFDPHTPAELAELLWQVWQQYDPATETMFAAGALAQLPVRRRRFAENYMAIVRDLVSD